MTDENEPEKGSKELPFARAYDFFKHMTGISLISIGGVFAFVDGSAAKIDPVKLVVIMGFICLAGVVSLLQALTLAGLESQPVAHAKLARQVKYGQFAATGLLMVGLGAFIQSFTKVIL